jgi:NADPH-dependent 2,4-dienoyl-CoA reductase/sulfur reductase-like enzyme
MPKPSDEISSTVMPSSATPDGEQVACEGEKVDVVIVGGSVGGLACAHALLRSGRCTVTVFERASAIKAAGAVRYVT